MRVLRTQGGSVTITALVKLIALAQLSASHLFWRLDVPNTSVVLAIIEHESRGNPRVCKNEANGSSSRGLMMLNHPRSRCSPEDDARYASDYNPARNIMRGVWLLAYQSEWHRERALTGDPLGLYAGRGPRAVAFAKEIRELALKYEGM